jgi:hypothetical protein
MKIERVEPVTPFAAASCANLNEGLDAAVYFALMAVSVAVRNAVAPVILTVTSAEALATSASVLRLMINLGFIGVLDEFNLWDQMLEMDKC